MMSTRTTTVAHAAVTGRAVIAAAFLTAICLLPVMLSPYIAGAAARDLALDASDVGVIAMVLLGGTIAVMASSVAWINKANWRRASCAGAVVATVAYACASQARSFPPLLAWISLASCGTGVAYAPAIAALGAADNPDRSFGYAFFMQIILSGIAGFIATQFSQQWGLAGVMGLLSGLFALSLAVTVLLPTRAHGVAAPQSTPAPILAVHIYVGLAGVLLLAAGPTAIWVFFEQIGEAAGISATAAGNAIAVGLLLGAPGALLSASVGKRFGRIGPLTLSTLLMVATFIAVVSTGSLAIYVCCALSFQFLWNFTLSFQYGAVSAADVSGRLIVLAPVCQGVGGVVGAGIAGELVRGGSYWPVVGMAAVTSIAGLAAIARLCLTRPATPLLSPGTQSAEKLGAV